MIFRAIRRPKANNWGKWLILLVTLLFTGEEWLSLLTLLKTGLSRQLCSEKLLQIDKNIFNNNNTLLEKVAKNWRSIVWFLFIAIYSSSFEYFGLFAKAKFFFVSRIYCRSAQLLNRNGYQIKTNMDQPWVLG